MREIERRICGCDYGGTSWTKRREAEDTAARLKLAPDRRLLEIGAGTGWPGLYLARMTKCDVTLLDLPLEGLRIAQRRAAAEHLSGHCRAVVAAGEALPFAAASFDAISHCDVLCCLAPKLALLAPCRGVIRVDGVMVFTVISIASGLSTGHCHRPALHRDRPRLPDDVAPRGLADCAATRPDRRVRCGDPPPAPGGGEPRCRSGVVVRRARVRRAARPAPGAAKGAEAGLPCRALFEAIPAMTS
jgi:SAM-dependent methyltransferase